MVALRQKGDDEHGIVSLSVIDLLVFEYLKCQALRTENCNLTLRLMLVGTCPTNSPTRYTNPFVCYVLPPPFFRDTVNWNGGSARCLIWAVVPTDWNARANEGEGANGKLQFLNASRHIIFHQRNGLHFLFTPSEYERNEPIFMAKNLTK